MTALAFLFPSFGDNVKMGGIRSEISRRVGRGRRVGLGGQGRAGQGRAGPGRALRSAAQGYAFQQS